ncbi:MAG: hypothetical protein FJY67_01845 [Calditrichaeota bacterium]|nr:hypothetical protein [Calditrichota bacterium]
MRFCKIICALGAVLFDLSFAQPGVSPVGTASDFLSSEHTPVIWSGSGRINGAGNTYTTSWLQIGYSPSVAAVDNSNIARFNPERFTLTLKVSNYNVGDSAVVGSARFELAYDTTAAAAWSADSTNRFIQSGGFNHPLYGQGVYEALLDTARRWDYPLRIPRGGFIRFVFGTTTADSVNIAWTLWGEN